jgi:type II secretory pathway component PulJ
MSNSANKAEHFGSEKEAKAKVKSLEKSGQYHNIKHTPPKQGVAEGSETAADIDKQIEFHKQGQAAAQYKGAMNKMHAKKIKDLEAKKQALKQGVAEAGDVSHLHKALDRALSKEKKASPAQVQRNKERWAQRQAEKNKEVDEGYDKWGWHTSLTNGEFMPTKYGNKDYVYLHDLDNESPRGGPQLVTVNKPTVAKRIARQFGAKVVKTDLNTYRIVKPAEQGVAEAFEYFHPLNPVQLGIIATGDDNAIIANAGLNAGVLIALLGASAVDNFSSVFKHPQRATLQQVEKLQKHIATIYKRTQTLKSEAGRAKAQEELKQAYELLDQLKARMDSGVVEQGVAEAGSDARNYDSDIDYYNSFNNRKPQRDPEDMPEPRLTRAQRAADDEDRISQQRQAAYAKFTKGREVKYVEQEGAAPNGKKYNRQYVIHAKDKATAEHEAYLFDKHEWGAKNIVDTAKEENADGTITYTLYIVDNHKYGMWKPWKDQPATESKTKGRSALRYAIESVEADQKKAKQVPATEMPKKTSPVIGQKEKQHPFKGRAVGGN